MLLIVALVAILGWSIAALSITALLIGVLPLLSTGQAKAAKDGENHVDIVRMSCSVCGSHAFQPIERRHSP